MREGDDLSLSLIIVTYNTGLQSGQNNTKSGRRAGPAHTRPRPTSGPRLARRINKLNVAALVRQRTSRSSLRLPPHNQSYRSTRKWRPLATPVRTLLPSARCHCRIVTNAAAANCPSTHICFALLAFVLTQQNYFIYELIYLVIYYCKS